MLSVVASTTAMMWIIVLLMVDEVMVSRPERYWLVMLVLGIVSP